MIGPTNHSFSKGLFVKSIIVLFGLLSIWWVSMYLRDLRDAPENNYFTLIYPFLSLAGGLMGLVISSKWGGLKSLLGWSLCMFSFGLLAQFFGQAMYAYFIYVQGIEVPYPSLGDVGYFGSVIFYILGAFSLTKVIGFKLTLRSYSGKLLAFAVPAVLLLLSYILFLNGYEFVDVTGLTVLLDFGYPLGQAIYVSIALYALLSTHGILGGVMKKAIIFLIVALVAQYFADFTFLYQSHRETWYVGGVNDYLYALSYFLMTLALVYTGNMFEKIKQS